jgi:hypothetical protein
MKTVTRALCISQQHGCIWFIEDRIVDISIASTQRPLHNNHLKHRTTDLSLSGRRMEYNLFFSVFYLLFQIIKGRNRQPEVLTQTSVHVELLLQN